jgi:polysaccharide chain length determinant protein (PEP-CTERM system associated)
MPLRPNMEARDFIEIFARKKWLIVFLFLLVMFGAAIYCVLVPDRYMSTVKMLVIPPQVSEALVRSTMNYRVQERIGTIREQVLSRTRLIEAIDELDLFRDEELSLPPEALAQKLQDRTRITASRGGNTFTLSFVHEDPKTAMLTASKLASFFVEENIRVRELESLATSEFLDSQLLQTKKRLEEQEERIKGYKMQHLGELPQQMDANLSLLSRLQEQDKSTTESIMRAEDRKVFLESEITKLQRQELGGRDPVDALVDAWEQKQKQLRELSTKYTESYPTVVQLRSEIEQLEARILAMDDGERLDPGGNTGTLTAGKLPVRRPRRESEDLRRLRGQVAALNLEIAALRREKEEGRQRIQAVEAKVARLPQREQELISLTRDYENLRRSYEDLLNRKLQARVSQNLEEGQQGERFQILDPANLPSAPFEPDRVKVLGLSLLGALGLGFGGALGLAILDPTLRNPKEFRHFFDIPILATIPVIQDKEMARKKRLRRKALVAGLVSFACAIAVFLLFYHERIRIILKNSGGIG